MNVEQLLCGNPGGNNTIWRWTQSGTSTQNQTATKKNEAYCSNCSTECLGRRGSKMSLWLVAMVSIGGCRWILCRCGSSLMSFTQQITDHDLRKLFWSVVVNLWPQENLPVTSAPPSGTFYLAQITHDFHLRPQFTTWYVSRLFFFLSIFGPKATSQFRVSVLGSSNLSSLTSLHWAKSFEMRA